MRGNNFAINNIVVCGSYMLALAMWELHVSPCQSTCFVAQGIKTLAIMWTSFHNLRIRYFSRSFPLQNKPLWNRMGSATMVCLRVLCDEQSRRWMHLGSSVRFQASFNNVLVARVLVHGLSPNSELFLKVLTQITSIFWCKSVWPKDSVKQATVIQS